MNPCKMFGLASFFFCVLAVTTFGCVTVEVETDGTEFGPEPEVTLVDSNDPCFVFDESTQQILNLCTNVNPILHNVTIAAHEDVFMLLPNVEADGILDGANAAAQVRDEPRDITCNVQFDRVGDVQEFDDTLDINEVDLDVIDTTHKFHTVRTEVKEWVKMVSAISWCWNDSQELEQLVIQDQIAFLWGCADSYPNQSVFVVPANVPPPNNVLVGDQYRPPKADEVGVLWLHEFGHNKNNYHVNAFQDETRVMYPTPATHRKTLSTIECGRYHIPSSE